MEEDYKGLFNYKIIYSSKRKRTIGFKIQNNTLIIISPTKVSKKFLIDLIEKKKCWAIEKINYKKNKRELVNNNKILFLGKEIDIKINETKLLKSGGYCELNNNYLTVNLSTDYKKETFEKVIKNWYTDECFKLISNKVSEFAKKYNLKYGKITIKEQKTVWGTCNHKNNLTFNWKVICLDSNVIDYLVVHELVHTVHKNHSKEYWKEVEKILPDYKFLNRKLKMVI